ncbi:hypothetical protein [Clostridium sp.]|uniref:hypothetical protein n=1 Tax=Clostridium sp. TaxID=1506 RepID=UPI00261D4B7C|nr:hypothetical protein [Clostridium sp.]
MKKRIILSLILGVVIVGGTLSVVRLNNKNCYQNIKEKFITSDESKKTGVIDSREVKSVKDDKVEEKAKESKVSVKDNDVKETENKKVVESKTETEKVEPKKEVEKNIKNKSKVSEQTNSKTESKVKESGQSLEEGYELSYRARDAYKRGDVDEALRLYNQITNKAALAKTVDEKKMYESSKNVENEILKCEHLYNQGDYMNARLKIKELLGGNRMSDSQMKRCVELIKKTDSKVGTTGEANLNKNFTYEKAVQLVKNYSKFKNQTYELAEQKINEDGLKTYYIIERDKKHKNYIVTYIVNSNGKVQEAC